MTPHGQPEPRICDKFLEQFGNRTYENLYRVNSCENHTVKRVERVDETSCELHAWVLGHTSQFVDMKHKQSRSLESTNRDQMSRKSAKLIVCCRLAVDSKSSSRVITFFVELNQHPVLLIRNIAPVMIEPMSKLRRHNAAQIPPKRP
ncbi:hypothetical protein ACCO45_004866 [Purpureocillium lilacinum]|uniref:Uncharacterized protein n=1 Tax=Purpureocillium lilacinum TaxID=33203 RepID=A0ACC4DTT6_PURLI